MVSKLPYRDLKQLEEFLELYWYDITAGGSFSPESKELENIVKNSMRFVEQLKKLYFKCAGCDRMVAPDEESYTDPATENVYCMKCLEDGI